MSAGKRSPHASYRQYCRHPILKFQITVRRASLSSLLPRYPCWSRAWLGRWHPQRQSIDRRLKQLTAHPVMIMNAYNFDVEWSISLIFQTFMMSLSSIISVVITWEDKHWSTWWKLWQELFKWPGATCGLHTLKFCCYAQPKCHSMTTVSQDCNLKILKKTHKT